MEGGKISFEAAFLYELARIEMYMYTQQDDYTHGKVSYVCLRVHSRVLLYETP